MTRVLVTGAAGSVGGEVARLLVERGQTVRRVMAQSDDAIPVDGVEVLCGDMSSVTDVARALEGVRRAFLEIPEDNGAAFEAGAARASLDHVVLLSSFATFIRLPSGDANTVRARCRLGEEALTRARVPSTFLRCAGFDDDILRWTSAIGEGLVRAPFADVPLPKVHPGDIAACTAEILAGGAPEPGAYVLTGPERITIRQEVAVLRELLGTPLTLEELSFDGAMASFPDGTPDLVRRSLLETLDEAASALVVTDDVEHPQLRSNRARRAQLPGLGFRTPRGVRLTGADLITIKLPSRKPPRGTRQRAHRHHG